MLFILNTECYVPLKVSGTVGSIHLFKITGKLIEVNMTLNNLKISIPTSVTTPLKDNFKVTRISKKDQLSFHTIYTRDDMVSFDVRGCKKHQYKSI